MSSETSDTQLASLAWLCRLKRVPASLALSWAVVAIVLLWAALPQLFTGYSGTEDVPGEQLRAPSLEHVLGTDGLGRDVYARIVYGARYSLSGAFVAVTVGLLIGTLLGLVAADVGVGIVPCGAVPTGRNLRAVPLEPRLVRRIGVITLREREPTPAAAGFLALLRREWPRQD